MNGRPLRCDAEVVENRRAAGANLRIRLSLPPAWPGSRPGQFAMLSPGARHAVDRFDPLLPRPMALYRTRLGSAGAEVEVLYKVVGRGTALLSEARPGQRVRFVGPLGRGFSRPESGRRAILVGGGTGIASLFGLAAEAASRTPLVVLLGARSADDLMGREDFSALPVDLRVATEDGSAGHPGRVTDLLEPALGEPASRVYACGPTPMMRLVVEIAGRFGVGCQVSLENRMACGYGVCLGCAAPRRGEGFHLVCRDGPVFEADELAWEGVP